MSLFVLLPASAAGRHNAALSSAGPQPPPHASPGAWWPAEGEAGWPLLATADLAAGLVFPKGKSAARRALFPRKGIPARRPEQGADGQPGREAERGACTAYRVSEPSAPEKRPTGRQNHGTAFKRVKPNTLKSYSCSVLLIRGG